ncbi:MAG: translocation/assembly module TamB domain-containing protein [Leptolyngbyaceae cyanobacterium MO_188.B28]|nr:translocation/assembly module TamB domain-containing protein [Leptolyngbyaceae cyanobacterium MO_188.B28]
MFSNRAKLLRVSIGLGGLILVGGAVGVWGGWRYVDRRLIPQLEETLNQAFGRPFELGEIERLSLRGVRVGEIIMPPTPDDDSWARVEAVDIGLDLGALILRRTLRPSITLIEPTVSLTQGLDGEWLDITLPERAESQGFFQTELEVIRIRDATLAVNTLMQPSDPEAARSPLRIEAVNGRAVFEHADQQRIYFDLSGQVGDGDFQVRGEGVVDTQAANLTIQSHDIPLSGVNLILPPALTLESGELSSQLELSLRPNGAQPISAKGVVNLRQGAVSVGQLSESISDINSTLRFKGREVLMEETGLQLGRIPVEIEGGVHLQAGYDLRVQSPLVSLASLQESFGFEFPIAADGEFQVDVQISGAIDRPQLFGAVNNLQRVQLDQLDFETVSADFSLTPNLFTLEALRIAPAVGGLVSGQGQIDLRSIEEPTGRFNLQANLPGDAIATAYAASLPNGIELGTIVADAQISGPLTNPEAALQWRLPEATYPGRGEVVYRDLTVLVQNTQFQVETGTVAANARVELDQGNWRANLETTQIPVDRFSNQIQGRLNSEVEVTGNLNALTVQAIQGSGTAQITDAQLHVVQAGPSLLEPGNWDSQFRWTGDRLQIETFTAPGIWADGWIAPQFSNTDSKGELALSVEVDEFDLRALEAFIPEAVQAQTQVSGLLSYEGQISGPLANPEIAGKTYLAGLGFNSFRFESALAGEVQFALSKGGTVDLSGPQARLAASLDARFLPTVFEIQNQDFLAQGRMADNQLEANIQNFPLAALDFKPAASQGLGAVGGLLNAQIQADLTMLSKPGVQGAIAITNPALGHIRADAFSASFSYAEHAAALTNGELQFGASRYLLAGIVSQSPKPYFQGELMVVPGHIEDIFTALQWFTIEDVKRGLASSGDPGAAALETTYRSLPNGPLLEQLEAFSAFMADWEAAQQRQETALAPILEELSGQFTGVIRVAGSSATDLTADFNIQGRNWAWGQYQQPNELAVKGRYAGDALTLNPVRFESETALVQFVGAGNLEQLDGELKIENVPVDLIQNFAALPTDLGGYLNMTAQLGGGLANPKALGRIDVAEASLNQAPLQSVGIEFNYDNAHLLFEGAVAAEAPGQLTFQGDIPYALPFMTVQPNTDLMAVEIEARNEGLGLINYVTQDRLRWEGGNGAVNLRVGGTFTDPAIAGTVAFQEGILVSDALTEPVSDLTGTVRFNLDQILVEQLQARLGKGRIAVEGRMPINNSAGAKRTDLEPGLRIALNQVPLDYEDAVKAKVDGQILVTGAVLAPVIGGELRIREGRVKPNQLLGKINAAPNTSENDKAVTYNMAPNTAPQWDVDRGGNSVQQGEPVQKSPLDRVRLNNFVVRLEDRLRILGQPFYNVTASGELKLNGLLTDLQPEGTVRLTSGWINLFANQFRLVGRAENTATFTPDQGLDPFLNVHLSSRVQAVNQSTPPPATAFPTSEVADTSTITTFGDTEIITVDARVVGPASQLLENLELTSRPPRTQEQIVGLIGGNIIGSLTGSSLTQFANFFGSGALASFSNNLSNVLGLRSLSVFPTTDATEGSAASVGIGVEASFAIGPRLDVTFLEVLNSGNPPQVGLNYRLSDELQLRGDTNLSGDNRVFLEYRVRF